MSNQPEPMAVVYKGRSNYERKGVAELEQHGVSAFTPYDESGKRARVTAPGYIFANREVNAAFLKHVRGKPLGRARLSAVANLHIGKVPRQLPLENPYTIGQAVYRGEVPAKVVGISGRTCLIETSMLGKRHTVAIHYTQLRPG